MAATTIKPATFLGLFHQVTYPTTLDKKIAAFWRENDTSGCSNEVLPEDWIKTHLNGKPVYICQKHSAITWAPPMIHYKMTMLPIASVFCRLSPSSRQRCIRQLLMLHDKLVAEIGSVQPASLDDQDNLLKAFKEKDDVSQFHVMLMLVLAVDCLDKPDLVVGVDVTNGSAGLCKYKENTVEWAADQNCLHTYNEAWNPHLGSEDQNVPSAASSSIRIIKK